MIFPSQFLTYLEKPVIFSGIVLSLSGTVFFASRMRKCAVSYEAFKFLMPAVLAISLLAIINKMAMDSSDLNKGVFAYVFFQSILMFSFGGAGVLLFKKKTFRISEILNKNLMKAASCVCACMFISLITKNYAYAITDNPSFPTAIILTSPFWILIFYRLTGHREKGNVASGLAMVSCIIVLVLLKDF